MGDIPYFFRILGDFVHFLTTHDPVNASKGRKSLRLGGLNMNLIRSDRFLTKMLMNGWITVHFGHVSAINWGRGALFSGTSLDGYEGSLPPNLTAILSSVKKNSNIKKYR